MKPSIKNLVLLSALFTGLGLIPASLVTAQTFTTLHNFIDGEGHGNPLAGLVLSGNTLYGTRAAALLSYDQVFSVRTDGTGFTNVYSFDSGRALWPTQPTYFRSPAQPSSALTC